MSTAKPNRVIILIIILTLREKKAIKTLNVAFEFQVKTSTGRHFFNKDIILKISADNNNQQIKTPSVCST